MDKIYPFPDQIDGDLKMIRGVTRSVRSYSSIDGFENIPGMAVRYGLECNGRRLAGSGQGKE